MKEFLSECKTLGLKTETLHTSGHADENAVRKLIDTINPDVIIPVHTVKQISAMLGISIDNVRKRTERAKKLLKAELESGEQNGE